jgi:eukaryotic-like serine/threonine-protein kinase
MTVRRLAVTGLALLAVFGSTTTRSASGNDTRVRVPAVVGMTARAARARVRAAGLVPHLIFGPSMRVRRGFVFAQEPAGKAYVERGSQVAVVVSLGKPKVRVPDVVGENFAQAVVQLRIVGLRPRLQNVVPSTRPADTVLAQTPEAGTVTARGSSVALAVSGG